MCRRNRPKATLVTIDDQRPRQGVPRATAPTSAASSGDAEFATERALDLDLLGPPRNDGHGARERNRRSILRAVASQAATTRADLARFTGLTPPSVSQIVQSLVEDEFLLELGPRPSASIGKPPTVLAVAADRHAVIAIDTSDAQPRGWLLDLDGTVREERTTTEKVRGAAAVDTVVSLARALAASSRVPVVGVGVGTPGTVDVDGTVVLAANLGWERVALQARLAAELGLPVRVANDADAAVLAELPALAPDRRSLALIRIGEGVGVGLVLAGRLYTGQYAAAGEIGHVVHDPHGPPCSCGKHGCLETFVGLRAIGANLGTDHPGPGGLDELLAADPAVLPAVERAAEVLAGVVVQTVALLDVRDIVVSTSLSGLAEHLAAAMDPLVRGRLLASQQQGLQLRPPTGRDGDLVIEGAHALVLADMLGIARPVAQVSA